MSVFERLAIKIKQDTGYELVGFRRTYAGKEQRSAGRWVWCATRKGTDMEDIGSTTKASDLVKAEKIYVYRDESTGDFFVCDFYIT